MRRLGPCLSHVRTMYEPITRHVWANIEPNATVHSTQNKRDRWGVLYAHQALETDGTAAWDQDGAGPARPGPARPGPTRPDPNGPGPTRTEPTRTDPAAVSGTCISVKSIHWG